MIVATLLDGSSKIKIENHIVNVAHYKATPSSNLHILILSNLCGIIP